MTQLKDTNYRVNELEVYASGSAMANAGGRAEEQVETMGSDAPRLPNEFALEQNYPNPFNPSTQIRFALPEAGRVTLKVYSTSGQLVRALVDGEIQAGRHVLGWNGRNQSGIPVASGIYFYQLVVQKPNGVVALTETRRMALVK